jgi:hypothetical protein
VRIKSQRDFWSGLLFLVVGLGFAWGATNYNFGSSAKPGPGYFPLGLGMLLALLGAVVLFKALTLESEGGDPIGAVTWRPLLTVVTSVVVFGWAVPHLGMMLAIPVLVLMVSWAGDEFHLREVLINAAVLTVGSWLIFIAGLNLTIPVWPPFLQG